MNSKEIVLALLSKKRPDLSVAGLERELGISNGTIGKWNNATPSTKTAQKVADYFQVPLTYILGNTDDMHANKKSTAKDTVDVEKDPTILSLDGIEITDEYRQFIIDQIRTIRKMRGDDK